MSRPMLKRLEQVAAVQRQRRPYRSQHGLAVFTDEDLEELSGLARKAETAKRLGQPVDWAAEEILILDRLEAKRRMNPGW
jgi:hypothetical protein